MTFEWKGKMIECRGPYGFLELQKDIECLQHAFPFLHAESIGVSVMGRPLLALRLGSGSRSIFINGAFHANEWITAPVVLRFMEEAARALQEGKPFRGVDPVSLFKEVTLWAMPMVNPDGVDLVHHGVEKGHPLGAQLMQWNGGSNEFSGWKANIRGVDLNDQFPAFWETERDRRDVDGPGPRDYTGEAPLSEPEAAAIASFTEAQNFDTVIAMHTQGQEIYWNYRDYEPQRSEKLAKAMERASGYKAVKLTGSDAGYKDWFIQRWQRPGFTVELGSGTNPLPIEQFPEICEEASAIVLQALLASAECN
jgi:g-D-glutamyl-meso-diaminopimelate peptidase